MDAMQSDDLASLDSRAIINETTVIELIRKRYTQDRIYWIQTYQTTRQMSNLAPHVYSKAKDVLRSRSFSSTSQCCVVTGDSGAGKTEVTKYILQYITSVSIPKDASITSKLIQVYCILEAFGNATTLQNKNSSRFAVYFDILFSEEHKIFGGKVYHYMLEKSRVVHQEKGGKNFHIFHYILSGMSAEQRQEFHLSVQYPHRYLSYDPMVPAENDSTRGIQRDKFEKLLGSLDSLGFTTVDNLNIFKVLAAILHVGNVEFGVVDPQSNAAFVHDQQPVSCASSLLDVDANDLGTALVVGTAFRKGEKVSVRKNPEIAAEGRDNLAKALYSRLFAWIVFKMNRCLMVSEEGMRELMGPSIGLLDMFGFEKFDVNGLEQLCVNMTNEQLAYFYNERVFAWEQAEMESDGLRGHKTPYHDNKKALELLLSPPQGLLPLLDDESQSAKGTDAGFVKKCDNTYRKHPYYNSAKLSYPAFYVQHFTGHVNYVALGFITTNLDLLGTSLLHCMQGSKNEFISSLFKARVSGTGSVELQPDRPISPVTSISSPRKKDKNTSTPEIRHKEAVLRYLSVPENRHRFPSLVTQFRNSIAELMHKVLACDVHFVRCIKPNNYQSSDQFDHDTVLIQARSAVVVLTAHARSVGFPIWIRFPNFIHRFGFLVGLHSNPVAKNASQTCEKMLRKLCDPRGWKIGKTKVFLSYWCMNKLNALMDRVNSCATIIQKVLRGWYARKLYKRLVHLKGVQKKTVGDFIAVLGSQSEGFFQHISNQVMEEDTREMRKRNEGLQSQPWSPAILDHRSPASLAKGRDELDAAGQTSLRPPSLQEKVSDLSVSSLTDVFGPDSPTRPVPPQHRESNLSVVSVESNFSIESDDLGRATEIWCRVTCFERQFSRAEFSIDRNTFVIDGSNNAFDVTRIGLGALPESSDAKVNKVRGYIGKGVKIATDEEWNVWVTRKSKNPVFVKGHFLSEEVISTQGSLVIDKAVKVFDWESFVDVVRHYCQPQIFNPELEPEILSSASVFISFVKDGNDDVETPCWVQLDVLAALEQATAACRFANERQLEAKREQMNSMPAILRPRPGTKARELMAVANIERKVRPQRDIDTTKFSRKAWARKEVSVNPFLYGKKDELSAVHEVSIETLRITKVNNSGLKSPRADSSGSQLPATADSHGVAQRSQYGDTVDANTGKSEQPKKKVWARKKSEEGKPDKMKRKS